MLYVRLVKLCFKLKTVVFIKSWFLQGNSNFIILQLRIKNDILNECAKLLCNLNIFNLRFNFIQHLRSINNNLTLY